MLNQLTSSIDFQGQALTLRAERVRVDEIEQFGVAFPTSGELRGER